VIAKTLSLLTHVLAFRNSGLSGSVWNLLDIGEGGEGFLKRNGIVKKGKIAVRVLPHEDLVMSEQ
jgi:hypothetical protein